MKRKELKPCPFCGCAGAFTFYIDENGNRRYAVFCEKCGAETAGKLTPFFAFEAWNRRPDNE